MSDPLTLSQLAEQLPKVLSFARSQSGLEYWAEVCRRLEAEDRRQQALKPTVVADITVRLLEGREVVSVDGPTTCAAWWLPRQQALDLADAIREKALLLPGPVVSTRIEEGLSPSHWGILMNKLIPGNPAVFREDA